MAPPRPSWPLASEVTTWDIPEPAHCPVWAHTFWEEGSCGGDVSAPGTQADASTTRALPRDRPLASLSPLGWGSWLQPEEGSLGADSETGSRDAQLQVSHFRPSLGTGAGSIPTRTQLSLRDL